MENIMGDETTLTKKDGGHEMLQGRIREEVEQSADPIREAHHSIYAKLRGRGNGGEGFELAEFFERRQRQKSVFVK